MARYSPKLFADAWKCQDQTNGPDSVEYISAQLSLVISINTMFLSNPEGPTEAEMRFLLYK